MNLKIVVMEIADNSYGLKKELSLSNKLYDDIIYYQLNNRFFKTYIIN